MKLQGVQLQVVLSLLIVVVMPFSSAQSCPVSGCSGCGNSTVNCSSAGLTNFPQFPPEVQQATQELYLNNNSISSLDAEVFENYTSLIELDLSDNSLSSLPENVFTNATNLQCIDLSKNSLTVLPENLFATNTKLRLLEISCNALTGLPAGVFDANANLESIFVSKNPLDCDCNLRWLPSFLESRGGLSIHGNCSDIDGPSMHTLSEEQLVCACVPACVNGTCNMTVGACECSDGYGGEDCGQSCTPGTWGTGCLQNCTCLTEHESSPCDVVNGTCHCLPGYTAKECQQVCPEGNYGQDCLEACQCQNNATCDPFTGSCTCTAGWTGPVCETSCSPGTWGTGCLQNCTCLTEHESSPCDVVNGTCHCLPGYTGVNCESSEASTEDGSSSGTQLLIIGSAAGATCALIVVITTIAVVTVVMCKRRGKSGLMDASAIPLDSKTSQDELAAYNGQSELSSARGDSPVVAGGDTPNAQDTTARSEGLTYRDGDNHAQSNSNSTAFERVHAEATQLYSSQPAVEVLPHRPSTQHDQSDSCGSLYADDQPIIAASADTYDDTDRLFADPLELFQGIIANQLSHELFSELGYYETIQDEACQVGAPKGVLITTITESEVIQPETEPQHAESLGVSRVDESTAKEEDTT